MTAAEKDPHLDPLALDAVRAGEGSTGERGHIERCDSCREALLDLGRFSQALKARASQAGDVPVEVDRVVLALARRELAGVRPRKVFRFKVLAAAAALLLTAAGLWLAFHGPSGPGGRRGEVDIVDAYLLALRIRSGDAISNAWDMNQDGVVDGRDVEAIARRSVSLSKERPR